MYPLKKKSFSFAFGLVSRLLLNRVVNVAAGKLSCWDGSFTYKSCCAPSFGSEGNLDCWIGPYTYQRCCQELDIDELHVRREIDFGNPVLAMLNGASWPSSKWCWKALYGVVANVGLTVEISSSLLAETFVQGNEHLEKCVQMCLPRKLQDLLQSGDIEASKYAMGELEGYMQSTAELASMTGGSKIKISVHTVRFQLQLMERPMMFISEAWQGDNEKAAAALLLAGWVLTLVVLVLFSLRICVLDSSAAKQPIPSAHSKLELLTPGVARILLLTALYMYHNRILVWGDTMHEANNGNVILVNQGYCFLSCFLAAFHMRQRTFIPSGASQALWTIARSYLRAIPVRLFWFRALWPVLRDFINPCASPVAKTGDSNFEKCRSWTAPPFSLCAGPIFGLRDLALSFESNDVVANILHFSWCSVVISLLFRRIGARALSLLGAIFLDVSLACLGYVWMNAEQGDPWIAEVAGQLGHTKRQLLMAWLAGLLNGLLISELLGERTESSMRVKIMSVVGVNLPMLVASTSGGSRWSQVRSEYLNRRADLTFLACFGLVIDWAMLLEDAMTRPGKEGTTSKYGNLKKHVGDHIIWRLSARLSFAMICVQPAAERTVFGWWLELPSGIGNSSRYTRVGPESILLLWAGAPVRLLALGLGVIFACGLEFGVVSPLRLALYLLTSSCRTQAHMKVA